MEYDPNRLKNEAKNTSILDVAQALGMKLNKEGREYVWEEHPSLKILPSRNYWSWFSKEYRAEDTIKLVEVIKGISFKEAFQFVLELGGKTFTPPAYTPQEPFRLPLQEVKSFKEARKYLKKERGLSDETIDFFLSKGIMSQGVYTHPKAKTTEPVIIFKNFDTNGKLVGGAIQGIWFNKKLYPERGRVKKTLWNTQSYSSTVIDIGEPSKFKFSTDEKPFKAYAFEAPIDMMSYYQLHKNRLNNCRLIAMHGKSKRTISRAVVEAVVDNPVQLEKIEKAGKETWLDRADGLDMKSLKIILCMDNDYVRFDEKTGKKSQPGQDFFRNFGLKKTKVVPHFPPLNKGQKENDWNDELKWQNTHQPQQVLTHSKNSIYQAKVPKQSMEQSELNL